MTDNSIHADATPRNKIITTKRDDYTKDRFEWLDQVVADSELPASASKVAYAIATSLWRVKGTVTLVTSETKDSDNVREAWIGTRDIADMIAMSRFAVMRAVDLLEERGHLGVERGQRGRGHSNHYRLVRKGAHSVLLAGKKAKPRAKPKGAPTHLLDGEKVRPRTSRGAPAHLNPSVPSEVPSEEERGAPQAPPRRAPSEFKDSSKEPESLHEVPEAEIVPDDIDTGALAAPPRPIVVQIDAVPDGLILDENGVEYRPPPPHERRPTPRTWMDAAFEGYPGGRS